MPKIKEKGKPERPYVRRCTQCGCTEFQQLISRFKIDGSPGRKISVCAHWPREPHACGDEAHEGCVIVREHCTCLDPSGDASDNGAQQHDTGCPLAAAGPSLPPDADPWAPFNQEAARFPNGYSDDPPF